MRGAIKALTLSYQLDEPLHYIGLDGDDYRSTPSWRDDKLLIRPTTELERGKRISSEETFSLADDGSKLISAKQEDGEEEHSTCTSTFEKSGATTASGDGGPVKITFQNDKIAIAVAGKPFTNLYMGQEARKPYLYPLRTASGKKVTRGYPVEPLPPDATDHPQKKALWVGAEQMTDEASGRMDLWENDPSYNRPNLGALSSKIS